MAEMRMPSKKVTATYAAKFRKKNEGEIRKGVFHIRSGNLKGVVRTFSRYGWHVINIKKVESC